MASASATSRRRPAERAPGARRQRTAKAEASRERVLAAAARAFTELGYAGASMRAIADAADMRAGSIYYHFPSKERLVAAVLEVGTHGVTTGVYHAIASLPAGASGAERIRAAIHAHLRSVLEFGDYALAWRRVHGHLPPDVLRHHIARRDALDDFWTRLLESARDEGEVRADLDLRLARTMILTALNSVVEWYRPGGRSPEEIADQFARMIAEGLLKRSDRA